MLGTLLWPHPGGPCPGVAFFGYFPCPIALLCTQRCTAEYTYMLCIFIAQQGAPIGPQRGGQGGVEYAYPIWTQKKRPKAPEKAPTKHPKSAHSITEYRIVQDFVQSR